MAKTETFIITVNRENGFPLFNLSSIDPALLNDLKNSIEIMLFSNISSMRQLREYTNGLEQRDVAGNLNFSDCKTDHLVSMKKAIESELSNRNSQLVIF